MADAERAPAERVRRTRVGRTPGVRPARPAPAREEAAPAAAERDWREEEEERRRERRRRRVRMDVSRPSDDPSTVFRTLPTTVKRSLYYLFAKYVAGFAGITDISAMFDVIELSKQLESTSVTEYHHVFLSAISLSNTLLTKHSTFTGQQIIEDAEHPYYEAYAEITGFYLRKLMSMKPSISTALRQQYNALLDDMIAEGKFIRVLQK